MRHPKVQIWERKLKQVFDLIDEELEAEYGDRWPLHPARPPHGTTANRESDGLFNVGAAFSAGFGSKLGRGYIVEIRIATRAKIPPEVQEEIEQRVVELLNTHLPATFPDQKLQVSRCGHTYKIHGDLSLGSA